MSFAAYLLVCFLKKLQIILPDIKFALLLLDIRPAQLCLNCMIV